MPIRFPYGHFEFMLDSLLIFSTHLALTIVTRVNMFLTGLMRIKHSGGEHLVVLTHAETAVLVEASALLVLASLSVAGGELPLRMASVLGQLFGGLRVSTAISALSQGI